MKKRGVKWVSRELVWSPPYIGICTSEADFTAEIRRLSPGTTPPDWIGDSDA